MTKTVQKAEKIQTTTPSPIVYDKRTDVEWQHALAPDVYRVCRAQGTEPAFSGKYDRFYEDGVYCCACCGGDYPLFSSEAKFDSKTGWPSFFAPASMTSVKLVEHNGVINHIFGTKQEVVCGRCHSHLGHVFDDGPQPTGKRYCMNSVALHFIPKVNETKKHEQSALFAGGCFWCEEEVFAQVTGVKSVSVGFTGGTVPNPTYELVSKGGTGHQESVQIIFDPALISYEKLLDLFWQNIDPFDSTGQFCDKGESYKAVIFYTDDTQKEKAFASKKQQETILKKPIVIEIRQATAFYRAEEYHQDYARKNPVRYNYYRWRCGRDARLKEVWQKK